MKKQVITLSNQSIPLYICDTVIVGTGAAGYNAADTLYQLGQTDIAMVTNGVHRGTSRNTGSDKQTYYKLSLAGNRLDSPLAMAQDLFNGGCVDGDIALCEATLSTQCFYKLCSLGIPFPKTRYGEYVGYQTDHDTACRATSAGPLTSKLMTEQLEKQVALKNIPVFNNHQVIDLYVQNDEVKGLLCYTPNTDYSYALFHCNHVIYATGGPAGLYARCAYPESQVGATGVALQAGVKANNLTEWQFGLASLSPRWNVSGTYMQVLPRFFSVDQEGNEYDFVTDYFKDYNKALSCVFKKGYQWPFDVRKLDGSSIIDLLVYQETTVKNRKVFLDFTKTPLNVPLNTSQLEAECSQYLKQANADFGTPVERLIHMNQPAYELYKNKGVDLKVQPLEIDVCAQHNNGGLAVDCWWQTNIKGFFACGEVAGTHGVFRPGGSALNAGQVGSTRSAQYIAHQNTIAPKTGNDFLSSFETQINNKLNLRYTEATVGIQPRLHELQNAMNRVAGIVRSKEEMQKVLDQVEIQLEEFHQLECPNNSYDISLFYTYHDMLICAQAYLTAMLNLSSRGYSRGSALYPLPSGGNRLDIPFSYKYQVETNEYGNVIQETVYNPTTNSFTCHSRPVREIPNTNDIFENVWRSYRQTKNIE